MGFSLAGKRIYVAGHTGMVGQALCRRLQYEDGIIILTATRQELDLTNQSAVHAWISQNKPDVIFMCAARVGGIQANVNLPADFLYDNIMIEANIIHAAKEFHVNKLLFLGSSCIYPRHCPQPIKEEYLFDGQLEPTNEAYALAKLAGVKICQAYRRQYGCDFIAIMPPNLYGPGDNFDQENSHVPAALMARFHAAKINHQQSVNIWGTGTPKREFMHVDDLADALVFLMQFYSEESHINVGTGRGITIQDFAMIMADIVGFEGEIRNDLSKPDGTPVKVLDVSKINKMGWQSKISLRDGLNYYYEWYLDNQNNLRTA